MKLDKRYILNYVFLLAMLVLVTNDHLLKGLFGNLITGKLSDVAGIIALPFFLSYFFPKFLKANILVSALLFTFWKLPISESFIQFYNSFTPILIERVIDYSDLLVLALLPFVFMVIKKVDRFSINAEQFQKIPTLGLVFVSTLIFMATSPPKSHYFTESTGNVRLNWSKKVSGTEKDAIQQLKNSNLSARKDSTLIKYLENFTSEAYQENKENFQYYIIDSIVIDDEVIRAIQFSFYSEKEGKPKLYLNAINLEEMPEDIEEQKELKKKYKEKLKSVFKKALQ